MNLITDGIAPRLTQRTALTSFEDPRRGSSVDRRCRAWLPGLVLLLGLVPPATHAATVEYIHTDALGSVVAVTNSSGQVVGRREYEPYGRQLSPLQISDGPGYTGHVTDAATGMSYKQQRYYDPQIGRFLSVDPVSANSKTGGNFNRYWYANNNPYKFFDPDGRLGCTGTRIQSVCDSGGVAGLQTSARSPLDAGRGKQSSSEGFTKGNAQSRFNAASSAVDKVRDKVEAHETKTKNGSAVYFSHMMQPISTRYGVEIGAIIEPLNLKPGFHLTDIRVGREFGSDGIGYTVTNINLAGYRDIHTHPIARFPGSWFDPFSSNDIRSYGANRSGYVSIPDLRVFYYSNGGAVKEVPLE